MFSFGAPQQQTQQTPFGSSGGGAFGQTPLQTPGLGGTTAMGFGGFGQTPATSAPAGPGGLFGGGATATPGTGLFGQAPKMTTTAPTPGLFGQALFGATPATSAATPGLFGQTPAFGATPGGLFGAAPTMAAPAAPTGQLFSLAQQQQQPIQLSLQDHLSNLAGAWNPASPACQFKVLLVVFSRAMTRMLMKIPEALFL